MQEKSWASTREKSEIFSHKQKKVATAASRIVADVVVVVIVVIVVVVVVVVIVVVVVGDLRRKITGFREWAEMLVVDLNLEVDCPIVQRFLIFS